MKNLIRFLNTPADSILFEKKWGNIQPTEADIFLKKFSLEEKLLKFQSHKGDSLSLEDALRGIVIFGATGSGKTSGSGEMIANSFLRKKMGGLILCVKQEEAQEWTKRALKCGRKKDLVLTGAPGKNVESARGEKSKTPRALLKAQSLRSENRRRQSNPAKVNPGNLKL